MLGRKAERECSKPLVKPGAGDRTRTDDLRITSALCLSLGGGRQSRESQKSQIGVRFGRTAVAVVSAKLREGRQSFRSWLVRGLSEGMTKGQRPPHGQEGSR